MITKSIWKTKIKKNIYMENVYRYVNIKKKKKKKKNPVIKLNCVI